MTECPEDIALAAQALSQGEVASAKHACGCAVDGSLDRVQRRVDRAADLARRAGGLLADVHTRPWPSRRCRRVRRTCATRSTTARASRSTRVCDAYLRRSVSTLWGLLDGVGVAGGNDACDAGTPPTATPWFHFAEVSARYRPGHDGRGRRVRVGGSCRRAGSRTCSGDSCRAPAPVLPSPPSSPAVEVDHAELAWAISTLVHELDCQHPWRRDALCRERDLDWFPGRGEPTDVQKALCAASTVRSECAAFALALGVPDGIWGGLSGRQRRVARGVKVTSRKPSPRRARCTECDGVLAAGREGLCCACEESGSSRVHPASRP
jgi:WhiB family transcriptional regulator, redox-sensing transcriptional regulator